MFARYALPEVLSIIVVGGALSFATGWYFGWWAVLPAVFFAALLSFYRDPPRRIPRGDDLLVSPADGWIVDVQLDADPQRAWGCLLDVPQGARGIESGGATDVPAPPHATDAAAGKRMLVISIFLTVADVHLNRSPCAGTIRDVRYKRGKFLNALKKESIVQNEQNTVFIDPAPPLPGPISVTQIAGGLARRIVCAARAGDKMTAGQRFGMIKLGSRTILTAPADERWDVRVRTGQHVRGGATILARLRKPESAPRERSADRDENTL